MTGSTPIHGIPYLTGADKLQLLDDWSQDLAESMDTLITYVIDNAVDAITPALYSYEDHGEVVGTVSIDPAIGHHDLDATGPTVLYLENADDGMIVSLCAVTGADQVTVDNVLDDVTLTDDAIATFMHRRGDWRLIAGVAAGPADTTPPPAVTDLEVTGGSGTLSGTWTAVVDADGGTVRYAYRYRPTSGGTWTTRTTAATSFHEEGVAANNYAVEVYSYTLPNNATAPDTATATVTAPLVLVTEDTFTGPNGSLTGHVAETGQTWLGSTAGANIISNRLSNGSVWINNGAVAREIVAEVVFPAGQLFEIFPWVDAAGSNGGTPRSYLSQSGQVSLNEITVTYNAAGTTNNFTPDGFLPLAADSTHVVRTTYDGTKVALYVDDVKIIEGTPTVAPTGTHTRPASSGAPLDRLVVRA